MQFMVASDNVKFTFDPSDSTYLATINLQAPQVHPQTNPSPSNEDVNDGTFREYAQSEVEYLQEEEEQQ